MEGIDLCYQAAQQNLQNEITPLNPLSDKGLSHLHFADNPHLQKSTSTKSDSLSRCLALKPTDSAQTSASAQSCPLDTKNVGPFVDTPVNRLQSLSDKLSEPSTKNVGPFVDRAC